jgi:hypothetical protein
MNDKCRAAFMSYRGQPILNDDIITDVFDSWRLKLLFSRSGRRIVHRAYGADL